MAKIKIAGVCYSIQATEDLIRDSGRQAEINFVDRKIRVDSSIYETDKGHIAILHEVLHGIFEGLCFESENENEHLIQCLAVSLYQVFSDNKEYFATIAS
ncbi:MAG: hypothetical protein IJX30_03305 [Clostridia bacterium]|nr:hypothetical protein [Clostridia bacterium]